MFEAPVWVSAFRPFYLLGAAYGALLLLVWPAAFTGHFAHPPGDVPLAVWHGHEMVFGFSSAIVCGILLTALPSWVKTEEVRGAPLAFLVCLWLLGRAAMWLGAWIPPVLVALADCALPVALVAMIAPQLVAVRQRWFLAVVPVLVGLAVANMLYHLALVLGLPEHCGFGVRAGVYVIVSLFVLAGGFLTPIFTGNQLRQKGRGDVRFNTPLEWIAVLSALAFGIAGTAAAPPAWEIPVAFMAAAVHLARLARWQGWKVLDSPLLWAMHVGYAWLVVAFALRGLGLVGLVAPDAWLHAFTVGGLGMMMMGLMARVSLRHTGRPLELPRAMRLAFALMLIAAPLRVAVGLGAPLPNLSSAAALCWSAAFLIYLRVFARMLLAPSLPRRVSPDGAH